MTEFPGHRVQCFFLTAIQAWTIGTGSRPKWWSRATWLWSIGGRSVSILGRLFRMVDHQNLDRAFLRFQFEPKPVLEHSEKRKFIRVRQGIGPPPRCTPLHVDVELTR